VFCKDALNVNWLGVTTTTYFLFPDWRILFASLAYGKAPPT